MKIKTYILILISMIMIHYSFSIFAEEFSLEPESATDQYLNSITPDEVSPLEKKILNQKKYDGIPNFVSLYRINYLLPYYYTESPYNAVYKNNTPDNQDLMQTEFKSQFSIEVPLVHNFLYNKNLSLHASYTQLMYWQFYARSQYFRETDYEPTLFINYHLYRNWLLSSGFNHQSNGKGGEYERSWNRIFGIIQFSGEKWFTKIDAWGLIFQEQSSSLHNPDIEKYLGHEHLTFAYKLSDLVLTLELQNIESGLTRGYVMGSLSYPMTNHMNLYAQYFNGYGQSLIEYDHRTQSFGLGVSFNGWL